MFKKYKFASESSICHSCNHFFLTFTIPVMSRKSNSWTSLPYRPSPQMHQERGYVERIRSACDSLWCACAAHSRQGAATVTDVDCSSCSGWPSASCDHFYDHCPEWCRQIMLPRSLIQSWCEVKVFKDLSSFLPRNPRKLAAKPQTTMCPRNRVLPHTHTHSVMRLLTFPPRCLSSPF